MNAMRPTRLNARLPIAAALGAAIATTALTGTARAQDGGRAFDEQILYNILTGIGLEDPNAQKPTYEQRPPLVIPKGDSLPPPRKPGAAVANNPAWPKDPDVLRAKALAKREKNRDTFAELEREKNPLPPSQLGPSSGPRGVGRPTGGNSAVPDGLGLLSPSQLGYKGGLFDNFFGDGDKNEETARFTGEPARTSLIEPPAGYRTPSPDQPYGLSPENYKPKADNSYITQPEGHDN